MGTSRTVVAALICAACGSKDITVPPGEPPPPPQPGIDGVRVDPLVTGPGETFTLELDLRNTAPESAVRIQLSSRFGPTPLRDGASLEPALGTLDVFDDGSHGDRLAADGVFTRDGLSLPVGSHGMASERILEVRFGTSPFSEEHPIKIVLRALDTARWPLVEVRTLASDAIATPRVVSLATEAATDLLECALAAITRRYYELSPDDRHLILVARPPVAKRAASALANRVRTVATGTGARATASEDFGSPSTLQLVVDGRAPYWLFHEPFEGNFCLAIHEIGHLWAAHTGPPLSSGAHWTESLARSTFGFGVRGVCRFNDLRKQPRRLRCSTPADCSLWYRLPPSAPWIEPLTHATNRSANEAQPSLRSHRLITRSWASTDRGADCRATRPGGCVRGLTVRTIDLTTPGVLMPSGIRSSAAAILVCSLISALPLVAQESAAAEPAHVLVLGTYHFANPGLDVVKTEVADVLSATKQAEVRAVVEALARFRPTKIAVEHLPASAPRLDSLYHAYRSGQHELSRDETEQLGFRLAAVEGHARIYPIDRQGDIGFEAVMDYAHAHDPAFVAFANEELARITAEATRRQRENTIGEILRLSNEPKRLARKHGFYIRLAQVGAADTYVGAESLSKWYERNIHIFSNLQRIVESGDRILVIIGSGHAPILRELISHDPRMLLVAVEEYLPRL